MCAFDRADGVVGLRHIPQQSVNILPLVRLIANGNGAFRHRRLGGALRMPGTPHGRHERTGRIKRALRSKTTG